ncbi:MAG TPA: right-handed parallel beta-helix repeat-containing protein, partial [Solirubrobacterales bacterium]|nr:right-handed parallel beta-helix repeat-containing protein [Solirubrobacterales bacterium]
MTLTAAGSPYTGTPTIAAGVTVKVEPGTHLTVGTMTVNGTLLAEGTAETPVRFTGVKEKEVGEWRSIFFKPGSSASVLSHVEVANGGWRDGGYSTCNNGAITVEGSAPTITNSTIRDACGSGIRVPSGGAPTIANNDFINAGAAIIYSASSGQSGEINIHDNFVEGSGGIGITAYSGAAVTGKTLSGNVVATPEGPGIVYSGSDIPGGITENTLSASKNNYIQISGTVGHSSTWNDGGTRVRFAEEVTVAAGATLHINPGVHLLNPAMTVEGTVLAEGTSEDPVRFTSSTETGVGQWKPIVFKPGSGSSVLSHVEVANGGWRDSGYPNCNKGAITIEGSSPTIVHSTIREACGYGITALSGGAPEIAEDTFVKAGAAIAYSASSGQSGEINIHDNYVEGGSSGIGVSVKSGASVNAKALRGNTVVGTEGVGVSYSGIDVPGDVTENTLSANAGNYILISGTVAHSSTWNDGGTRVLVGEGLTIAAGVTLRINPGVHLLNPVMTVEGTLLAEGTAETPVRFTGAEEKAIGEWRSIF